MRELELNLENLLSIGLTPEIIKNNFEGWIVENSDIQIDFDKKIIYTGISNLRKDLNNLMAIAKNELLEEGKTSEELEAFLNSEKEKVKANFAKSIKVFPDDESKQEFLLHILPKLHNQFLQSKTQYFDDKLSEILDSKILNQEKIAIIPNQYFNDISEKSSISNELEQIVTDLWEWQKNYEIKARFLHSDRLIEEKADYVTDTYKNYEERYLKYQLENCNIFLEEVPNDEVLIDCKKKLENKLIELRQQIPLPAKNIDILINEINNAFYRLEQFMKGKILDYKSFLFNDAFALLINELSKLENVNIKYDSIGNTYWYLMNQLAYAFDKSEFENQDAYKNKDFNRDSNEIDYIQSYRLQDLCGKMNLEDYQFELPSIIDIFNNTEIDNKNIQDDNKINKLESTDNSNPYPRIFTSHKSFGKFKKLREEFDNTKQNLSNYSFVYHRMVKDKFIFEDYKQTEFVFFLLDFDINISRIKPKTQLGNNDLRESIYNSLK